MRRPPHAELILRREVVQAIIRDVPTTAIMARFSVTYEYVQELREGMKCTRTCRRVEVKKHRKSA